MEAYGPVKFKMANNKMLLLIRHPMKCHLERLTMLKNVMYSCIENVIVISFEIEFPDKTGESAFSEREGETL